MPKFFWIENSLQRVLTSKAFLFLQNKKTLYHYISDVNTRILQARFYFEKKCTGRYFYFSLFRNAGIARGCATLYQTSSRYSFQWSQIIVILIVIIDKCCCFVLLIWMWEGKHYVYSTHAHSSKHFLFIISI